MSVKIKTLGVELPGRVLRTFDGDNTTLVLDEAQARLLHEELTTVVGFFDNQNAAV